MRKFRVGDVVKLDVKNKSMSHFRTGCNATLVYNYAQKYGGGDREATMWCVMFENGNKSSWYYNHDFTLVKPATNADELRVRRQNDKDDRFA